MKLHEIQCTPVKIARLFTSAAPEITDASVIESASTVNGVTRVVFRTGGGVSEGKFPVVLQEHVPITAEPEKLTSDSETFAPNAGAEPPSDPPKGKKNKPSVSGGLT